jgi:hypothetical protein
MYSLAQVVAPQPDRSFYGVAATVIPVLVLALAFQTRWFRYESADTPPDVSRAEAVAVLAAVGEVASLLGLRRAHDTQFLESLVVLSLFSLLAWLLLSVVLATIEQMATESDLRPERRDLLRRRAQWACAGLLAFALFVWSNEIGFAW